MSKNPKNGKFRATQMVKWTVFGLQNDQNWFHVKSEWQKNHAISTLCIPKVPIRLQRSVFAEIFHFRQSMKNICRLCTHLKLIFYQSRETIGLAPDILHQNKNFIGKSYFFKKKIYFLSRQKLDLLDRGK